MAPRDLGAALRAASPALAAALDEADELNLQLALAEVVPAPGRARGGQIRPGQTPASNPSAGPPLALERSYVRCGESGAPDAYFYPASAIKVCAAIAALQRVQALRGALGEGACDADSPLVIHGALAGAPGAISLDPTNARGRAVTVAHEVRKLFLVSDNDAFNRLYDFAGQAAVNRSMWTAGLRSTRVHHRLSDAPVPRTAEEDALTPAVEVHPAGAHGAYCLPPQRSTLRVPLNEDAALGRAHFPAGGGARVDAPLDCSRKNAMSLPELQDCLVKLLAPDVVPEGAPGFGLSSDHCELLREAMAQYPRASANPSYARERHPDEWCKFFLPGLRRVLEPNALRVYNKIGQAYGHTCDNAYIVDVETGRGFFLAATVYTNANGVLNDDAYEYGRGERLLADAAEAVARAVWQVPPRRPLSATSLCGWTLAAREAAQARRLPAASASADRDAGAAAAAAAEGLVATACWLG